jgi:hypothetical protein
MGKRKEKIQDDQLTIDDDDPHSFRTMAQQGELL